MAKQIYTLRTHPGAYLVILGAATALAAFTGTFDPDYEAYRLIYDWGGHWIAERGRDPLFVEFISRASEDLNYEAFRTVLALFFGFGLFVVARRLRYFTASGIGFKEALFLLPLIFLKFHIQIREGAALLLWLYAITANKGQSNLRSPVFWILSIVSSAIHASAVIWWTSTTFIWLTKRKALFTFLAFLVFGALTTTIGREFSAIEGSDVIFFSGLDDPVEVTPWKITYWLSFIGLPLFALWRFKKAPLSTSIFGLLGTFGLLGFFTAVLTGASISGMTEGDFTKSLRIANTLLIFLALHLSFVRPNSPFTWTLGIVCSADAIRVVLPSV